MHNSKILLSDLVATAQSKIKEMLARNRIKIKDVANETGTPYSTVRECLNIPGRLDIPWLTWYADRFGVTTGYLLSRDCPDKEIGENLKAAREHAGLSLREAAAQLCVKDYALDAIEKGEVEPTLSILREAVAAYRVPSWFILGEEQNKDATFLTDLLSDIEFLQLCRDIYGKPELGRFLSVFNRLSHKNLDQLVKFVDFLLTNR